MSGPLQLGKREKAKIDLLVDHFRANQKVFDSLLEQLISSLRSDQDLAKHVHSLKWRVKDCDHLRDKLARKAIDARAQKRALDITADNLFEKINDLAGCRILHLYTKQFKLIHGCLLRMFEEFKYELIEGPIARTWDNESRDFFTGLGVTTKDSPSLYTSVHYVIAPNRRTRITCEIQVRTLAEELWGEVDHTINYPHSSQSLACREQIKVLARVTSSCTRLVDSIFSSYEDHKTHGNATDVKTRRPKSKHEASRLRRE